MFHKPRTEAIHVSLILLALEIIGESRRIIYFLFDHIGWCIGYFFMDLIAYYERRWRYLHMYIVLSDVIAFLFFTLYVRTILLLTKIHSAQILSKSIYLTNYAIKYKNNHGNDDT